MAPGTGHATQPDRMPGVSRPAIYENEIFEEQVTSELTTGLPDSVQRDFPGAQENVAYNATPADTPRSQADLSSSLSFDGPPEDGDGLGLAPATNVMSYLIQSNAPGPAAAAPRVTVARPARVTHSADLSESIPFDGASTGVSGHETSNSGSWQSVDTESIEDGDVSPILRGTVGRSASVGRGGGSSSARERPAVDANELSAPLSPRQASTSAPGGASPEASLEIMQALLSEKTRRLQDGAIDGSGMIVHDAPSGTVTDLVKRARELMRNLGASVPLGETASLSNNISRAATRTEAEISALEPIRERELRMSDLNHTTAGSNLSEIELSDSDGNPSGANSLGTAAVKRKTAAIASSGFNVGVPCKLLSADEHEAAREKEVRAPHRIHVSVIPVLLYFAFIAASCFYVYTRIFFGMDDLAIGLVVYSYFILVVEVLGSLNMLFYGVWLFARPTNSDIKRALKENTEYRRDYIVRVLIPCYKESLPIIQRTVLAAKRAEKPAGTQTLIYLCDDGRDARKQEWMESLNDPNIIYVRGPGKQPGVLNGKSGNLNSCLRQIYPDVPDPSDKSKTLRIPINELMCLFDADQTCSNEFFTTMLRYIDSGDNVGASLSPQLMYNVIPDCDVFNHQNVHFWEMMQPGMDALGFISLTGTNMILRARALRDVDWFPINSVTEDWALGMRFKKLGWRCRYVNQYLAIGEAPDNTRQAFQQRSRWSKGHFQVFWSNECPLFDRRLNLFYRLSYSATCMSYLSTGIGVPVLNLVPLLTILFGLFPIALNLWTVLGITAYYGGLTSLAYYCHSWSHYKALWLANGSSVILFYPYLKASIFTPFKRILGRVVEFKTTLKGAAAASASLRTLAPALVIVLLNFITFVIGLTDLDVQVNASQAISLCWIVFNTVPHALLLFNAAVGPGTALVAACRIGMFLTATASAAAIILMWLLYPREADYVKAYRDSVAFVQAQMSGDLPQPFPIAWRSDSGQQYKNATVAEVGLRSLTPKAFNLGAFQFERDLSGGFYEDGPFGPIKLTKRNAMATSLLAWGILDAFEGLEDENPRLLEDTLMEVEHGVNFVRNCFIEDPSMLEMPIGDVYVYQVGDLRKEYQSWNRPEDVTEDVVVEVTAGVEQPTDLAAHMAAALVSGSMALQLHGRMARTDVDANMRIALRLYNVTMETEGVLRHPRDLWLSDSFYDDRLYAATWMYRASVNGFLTMARYDASSYFADMQTAFRRARAEEDVIFVSEDYVLHMGVVHAALNSFTWEFHAPAQSFAWDWVCSGKADYTKLGRAFVEDAPMLGDTVLAAALAQIYAIRARESELVPPNFVKGFQCFAQQQARYVLGVEWRRKSYMVGHGERYYKHTVHHGASCPSWPQECPEDIPAREDEDQNTIRGGIIWNPSFRDTPRDTRGGNRTAVSLGNNVAVPLLMAGLASKTVPWLECLQVAGAFLPHPVCKDSRPVPWDEIERENRNVFWGRIWDDVDDQANADALDASLNALPLVRRPGPLPMDNNLYAANWPFAYGAVTGLALQFYEAQRSGALPADNSVPWRGDSFASDGASATPTVNAAGGWYTADGTMKQSFPLCASTWRLAWNMISYKDQLAATETDLGTNMDNGIRQLRWAADYLLRAFVKGVETRNASNVVISDDRLFVVQVGNLTFDRAVEAGKPLSAEALSALPAPRPVLFMSAQNPGVEVAAEAVAAYASLATFFFDIDADLSVQLESHARKMYTWMQAMDGQTLDTTSPAYASAGWVTRQPWAHVMLASAWMFRLTGQGTFESAASDAFFLARTQESNPVLDWSNPLQEAKLIIMEANPLASRQYLDGLLDFVDNAMYGDGGDYTAGGLLYTKPRSVLAHAATAAAVAARTAAVVDDAARGPEDFAPVTRAHYARCFAKQQVDYILGSSGRSYVTGFGEAPPLRPRHRNALCGGTAPCTGAEWANANATFANVLPGALVGGPTRFEVFPDDHLDDSAEVSITQNAALLSGVTSLMTLPKHFWDNLQFCPTFPIAAVDWDDAVFRPVPGVLLPPGRYEKIVL